MSANNKVQMAWEECVVCPEKGKRIVHYYLRDTNRSSVLAVVGTERSMWHMRYVVSDEFIRLYGSSSTVQAGTRWGARRDVIEWLRSIIARGQPIPIGSSPQVLRSEQSMLPTRISLASLSKCSTLKEDEKVSREVNPEIEWKGNAWICKKELNHYPGFRKRGVEINVSSFVLIMGDQGSRYLGYLEDMYEDRNRGKMVNVQWFQYKEDVIRTIHDLDAHPQEVFITPHKQEISVECIDGVATVLTPNHFQKCLTRFEQDLPFGVFMCHRELKNNKVKPFSLSKLRGYCNQPLLLDLDSGVPSTRTEGRKLGKEAAKCGPSKRRMKLKRSSEAPTGNDLENIEVLCQDSGMRGCWFRSKILQSRGDSIKVQYCDILDVDGPAKLEEWCLAARVADSDKLDMRCEGRLTVRPWPPEDDSSSDQSLVVGAAVDSWWNDGWWEGVLIGCDTIDKDNFQVYLPGENKFLTIAKKNIRTSRDWIHNNWVDIKPKPDILSFLSTSFVAVVKLPPLPTLADPSKPSSEALTSPKCEGSKEAAPGDEGLNMKKRLIIKDDDDNVRNNGKTMKR